MGRGEAGAGHQGPFNEFISQIILPSARSRGGGGGGLGEGAGAGQRAFSAPRPRSVWRSPRRGAWAPERGSLTGVREEGPQTQGGRGQPSASATLMFHRQEPSRSKAKWEKLIRTQQ